MERERPSKLTYAKQIKLHQIKKKIPDSFFNHVEN